MPHVRIVKTQAELLRCLELRREVFIDEQRVPEEEEIDDKDDACVHFLALPSEGSPLFEAFGTARLLPAEGKAKAQRVAVRKVARRSGVGRAIMDALEEEARRRGFSEVVLGAQLSAIPFYERLGYEAYGEVFDDAGIPHRMMKKPLSGESPSLAATPPRRRG